MKLTFTLQMHVFLILSHLLIDGIFTILSVKITVDTGFRISYR